MSNMSRYLVVWDLPAWISTLARVQRMASVVGNRVFCGKIFSPGTGKLNRTVKIRKSHKGLPAGLILLVSLRSYHRLDNTKYANICYVAKLL